MAVKVSKDVPNFHVLRADAPFYQEDGSIRYSAGRSFFYIDDDHLSNAGALVNQELFRQALQASAK